MAERKESPSGGEIKVYRAKTPKGREKVRVIINVEDWEEETGWEIETEVDINKAWMKEGVRVNLKCFSPEKAQVAIPPTYPKMPFVPQESIWSRIVHHWLILRSNMHKPGPAIPQHTFLQVQGFWRTYSSYKGLLQLNLNRMIVVDDR